MPRGLYLAPKKSCPFCIQVCNPRLLPSQKYPGSLQAVSGQYSLGWDPKYQKAVKGLKLCYLTTCIVARAKFNPQVTSSLSKLSTLPHSRGTDSLSPRCRIGTRKQNTTQRDQGGAVNTARPSPWLGDSFQRPEPRWPLPFPTHIASMAHLSHPGAPCIFTVHKIRHLEALE